MNIVDNFIEVTFENPDNFRLIRETLTRIGVASRKERRLVQTCHILHKKEKYYIVHFLEMFLLDGKQAITNFTKEDAARRNTIIDLLQEWNLLRVVDQKKFDSLEKSDMSRICVVPHKEKDRWKLESKYTIGSH